MLAGQAISQLVNVSDGTGILIFRGDDCRADRAGLSHHPLERAAIEPDWRELSFFYLFYRLLSAHDIGELLANRHFSLSSFLLAISLSASGRWLSAYVADYSRYLPRSTSALKTFLAVGLGSVIGTQISMIFGVFVAALAGISSPGTRCPTHHWPGCRWLCGVAAVFQHRVRQGHHHDPQRLWQLHVSGHHRQRFSRQPGKFPGCRRLLHILVMVGAATALALMGRHSFLHDFSAFILFLLAFSPPGARSTWWTSTW